MRAFLIALYVLGFVIGQAGAGLAFRMAAEKTGSTAIWWFVAGNVIGFLCPVCLTFALKGSNANVIYALCFGISFCTLQIASWLLFHQPLSTLQWTGVTLVTLGIVLLQWR